MLKKLLPIIMLGLTASIANATVLINVPGIGATGQSSATSLAAVYDPTQSLWSQVDNAGVPDGATAIFSESIIAPITGNATHIQWGGIGNAGYGFVVGVWDLSVASTNGLGGMPGIPATFGNSNITGTQIAQLSLPVSQITTSAAGGGVTHFDAVIPSLSLTAGHNYAVSIVAVSTGWAPEIAQNCASANYTGCIMSGTGLGASTLYIMGALAPIFHAAPIAFQFTNDVVVTPAVPPVINTSSLPAATAGVAYTAAISSTVPAGDNATVTVTGLPAGLSFNQTTNTITGAAGVIGTFNVRITVADGTTGLSTSTSLSLTVNDAPVAFAPVNLPDATTNSAYTATFNVATGGYGSFTYTATGLPAGLTITSNTISGIPTVAGSYPISLTATDSAGTSSIPANISLNVINPVAAPVACSGTQAVVTAYLPRNPGYITVNGGLNLLDHLWTTNLNSSNTTFNGGLLNWYATGDIVSWTGTVDPTGCILSQLTVSPRVAISTTTLPNGVTGTIYSAPITIAWGVKPYTTTVLGLPTGLSFDGVNITGTPMVAGSFTVSVNTTDSVGVSAASVPLTLTVSAPVISSFSTNLPSATVGTAYSGTVSAIGGYGTLSYGATGLPAGLTLTGKNIAGTPTTAGTYSVAFTVTDSLGTQASTSSSITVASAVSTSGPSCTKPATGATGGLNSKGAITAIFGNVISFNTTVKGVVIPVSVTVPACAKITWNGGAKAFALGQVFEWNGYSSAATGNVAQSVTIN
jgi:PKD repeat protein